MIHALHGNFGLPTDWEEALPPGIPAQVWHLWEIRRHHPETHTLTGFASWFNNRIGSLPYSGPRVLAGYSLGGRLALHVLQDRPELWQAAVLISTHPGLQTPEERTARKAHDLSWQALCQEKPWPEVCSAWNAQPVLQGTGPLPDLGPLEAWRREIAGAFDGWSLGRQESQVAGFKSQELHIVWMAGADDIKFSRLAREVTRQQSGLLLQVTPHTGHRLLQEAPGPVQACLRSALDSLS